MKHQVFVRTFACRYTQIHKSRGATLSCVLVTWVVSFPLPPRSWTSPRVGIGEAHDADQRFSVVFPFLFAISPTRRRPVFRDTFRDCLMLMERHLSRWCRVMVPL